MESQSNSTSFHTFGFKIWLGHSSPMTGLHRHNEIEVNYLFEGAMTYTFCGARLVFPSRQLVAFWGAMPHQLVDIDPPGSMMAWITIPLTWLLQWSLPESMTHALLGGEIWSGQGNELDEPLFRRWAADMRENPESLSEIVSLEIEARIRRLVAEDAPMRDALAEGIRHHGGDATLGKVEEAARFIARHYTEELSADEIAGAVGLHPHYLMGLFRRHCGMSIGDYVIRLRVSHAQRLLITTDRKILDIAMDAGFGSLTRFYEAFGRHCHCAPRQYRLSVRKSDPRA